MAAGSWQLESCYVLLCTFEEQITGVIQVFVIIFVCSAFGVQ